MRHFLKDRIIGTTETLLTDFTFEMDHVRWLCIGHMARVQGIRLSVQGIKQIVMSARDLLPSLYSS
jgi:hypothetical protein